MAHDQQEKRAKTDFFPPAAAQRNPEDNAQPRRVVPQYIELGEVAAFHNGANNGVSITADGKRTRP